MRAPFVAAILAGVAALAIAAVALSSAGVTNVGSCGEVRGGGAGGRSQLRFVDAREDHATFTFGQSQEGQFQPPSYELSEGPRENGHRAFTLTFGTTSTVNPDGSPSLESLDLLQPDDRALREVRLVGEKELRVTWHLLADGGCPRVVAKRYTQGTFPRVQVAVVFDRRETVRYHGGIDSDRTHLRDDRTQYLRDALDDLVAERDPRVAEGKTFGCALRKW